MCGIRALGTHIASHQGKKNKRKHRDKFKKRQKENQISRMSRKAEGKIHNNTFDVHKQRQKLKNERTRKISLKGSVRYNDGEILCERSTKFCTKQLSMVCVKPKAKCISNARN